jgi:succinate dehydrogenase / fumarate reductase, iron-sulfur subunit
MRFTLRIWRQPSGTSQGRLVDYPVEGVTADMSFLEMLDVLNDGLIRKGEAPVAFDSDCREGICGMCSLVVDGVAHGPDTGTASCQIFMRRFRDGATITVEPWRAKAFPLVKDLVTDRSAFDRVIAAGGFVSANTGSAPEANTTPVPRQNAEEAMDAAACIGCGACVAACPNASAMLFVSAKVSHLALMPQGNPERSRRVRAMIEQHDKEGFGSCTNHGECEAVCPKEISMSHIARLNRELFRARLCSKD